MHPRIQEVLDYLDTTRTDLGNVIDRIPSGRRDERPAADRWSVAEILEHLAIIENRVGEMVAGAIDGGRAANLGPEIETTSILDTIDRSRIGDRSQRVTAPEIVRPLSQTDAASAWLALQQARERLKAAVVSGDGLALSEIKRQHPVLGVIDLYQWMLFVGAHEARHTKQVREIAQGSFGT